MTSSMYDRYKVQSDELPDLIKQLSHALQNLAGLTYEQLPFERGERETIEEYKDRLTDYFEKIHQAQVEVYRTLPDEAQHKLGETMASQDIEYREMIDTLQRGE